MKLRSVREVKRYAPSIFKTGFPKPYRPFAADKWCFEMASMRRAHKPSGVDRISGGQLAAQRFQRGLLRVGGAQSL